MGYDWIAFGILSLVAIVMGSIVLARARLTPSGQIIIIALVLRVFGSLLRHELIFRVYNGLGDAVAYFDKGMFVAESLWRFDFSVLSPQFWFGSDSMWWGTVFVDKLSGLCIALIGPSLRAEMLVFSLISFSGLCLIAVAFRREVSRPSVGHSFTHWIWLWPSLWYWPSSVGKEALTILAIGAATVGYVGRRGRANWLVFFGGVALGFAIRPHVGAVLGISALAAHWLQSWSRWNSRRVVESLGMLVLSVALVIGMGQQFGRGTGDLEIAQEWVSHRLEGTLQGGSQIGSTPDGVLGMPLAIVNVWMRPFLWEVHNIPALVSALELVLLWWLFWRGRSGLKALASGWRSSRILRFSLPLLFVYTLMIGYSFGNLGIIARQRTPVFPFVIMVVSLLSVSASRSPYRREA